ncbi:amino acid ABC transporter ATP-binding protein [Microterricola pindariensis]|uniref:Peptide ABC transporter ATP-binding protein n=1 Tax=Microterricola pindariensis TaxID=478010 RepID=A0ABX5B0U4_9MICO|nr:amino acid ABC transporter ATP-binding protein [Microterricola pindariensis]PPL20214.1 peptide ABC transporter ATP-binding protein [Microterricola pindariensis]
MAPDTGIEPPVLSLRGIRKSFGDVEVLRGIDLDVRRHEVVALIGSSGSGKSTLLRTANLLETIDDGQVFLSGTDVSDPRVKLDAVRARIGVVFQHYNLFPHLSVLGNVTLAGRTVHRRGKAAAERQALELLDQVGLADKAREFPDRLSGGQQQRVAIVRAIATDPELLLLDEITSALDPELVGEVLELVRTLAQGGSTILMATHEMAFARDVAHRVVFLDGGLIVEQGTPERLLNHPEQERTRKFLTRFSGTGLTPPA